jgi:Domain of unknown function (DUF4388)
MFEGALSGDEDDGNVVLEALPQRGVGRDVVLLQFELVAGAEFLQYFKGVFTERTSLFRVQFDARHKRILLDMRGLFGDFATMPLKDLIVYLGNKRATGVLALENEGVRKQAVLREGRVLNASSNEPREYLGQFLINLGHITEEQFNSAYETQKQTKIFLGKILVMIGALTQEQLENALSLKFRETLLQAFQWTDGSFEFKPDNLPALPEGLDLEIELLDVHREGEFRETAWQAIRGAFPSGSVRLSVDERNLPEPPRPGSLDERLVQLIREGQTIDDIILALHATDFFLYQRLYALYRLDAVRALDEGAVTVPAPTPPPSAQGSDKSRAELMAQAEISLTQGNYAEAESHARRAHALFPSATTDALLKKCEAALSGVLRSEFVDGRPIATLALAPAKLKALQLSAPERYLLSRVDGSKDVASIVQVSPLHELDALKLFQKLVDSGLVKLHHPR